MEHFILYHQSEIIHILRHNAYMWNRLLTIRHYITLSVIIITIFTAIISNLIDKKCRKNHEYNNIVGKIVDGFALTFLISILILVSAGAQSLTYNTNSNSGNYIQNHGYLYSRVYHNQDNGGSAWQSYDLMDNDKQSVKLLPKIRTEVRIVRSQHHLSNYYYHKTLQENNPIKRSLYHNKYNEKHTEWKITQAKVHADLKDLKFCLNNHAPKDVI